MKRNIREIGLERVRAELADTIQAAREENITLVHYNSGTGEAWRISPDGTIEPYEMVDETDWERVNAFTEEEIEAMAAADDSLPADWFDHATVVRKARFVMCINNKEHQASLTLRRVYKVIPDEKTEQQKMIRVVDDTGKDSFFPANCFVSVQLPVEAERSFDLVVV